MKDCKPMYTPFTHNLKLVPAMPENGTPVLDMNFHGYSDADWSGDPDTSKSTSGYVFITNRAAISWASK